MSVQAGTSSQSTDQGVGAARRRILEEEEPRASAHPVVPNGDSTDVVDDIDVKPGPSGLSYSAQLPAVNGSGKGGKKRRIVSEDEEEDDDDDEEDGDENEDEDDDYQEVTPKKEGESDESTRLPDGPKSQDDSTKGKALKKRDAAVAVKTGSLLEDSSSEDEKPIR